LPLEPHDVAALLVELHAHAVHRDPGPAVLGRVILFSDLRQVLARGALALHHLELQDGKPSQGAFLAGDVI